MSEIRQIFAFVKNIAAIRLHKINPNFLYLAFQSDNIKNQIEFSTVRSTQKTLSLKAINDFSILLPPLLEQRAIAEVLGVLDDKIDLNRRMNETLEGMAEALFKSWFVDFDPVHRNIARSRHSECNEESPAGARGILRSAQDDNFIQNDETFTAFDHLFPDAFEDSPLGLIPSGWGVEKIEKIISRLSIKKRRHLTN